MTKTEQLLLTALIVMAMYIVAMMYIIHKVILSTDALCTGTN